MSEERPGDTMAEVGAPLPRVCRARGRVTVVVPCHNRSVQVRDCLASVAAQTYPAIEVIVVDDASREDIRSAIEHTEWPHTFDVQFVRSERNVGPGGARELGRQRAKGDFICYLDSDDVWHPGKVAAQLDAFEQSVHAGMCYTMAAQFESPPIRGDELLRKGSDRVLETFLPGVLDGRPWGTGACMWRRSATDAIGPWSTTRNWEDYEYDFRAGCLGIRIAHVPRVLCFYRVGGGAGRVSVGNKRKRREEMAKSALIMADDLMRHRKAGDPNVRRRICEVLLQRANSLLWDGNTKLALRCLHKATIMERGLTRVGLVCRVSALATRVGGALNGARLTARLQRYATPAGTRRGNGR